MNSAKTIINIGTTNNLFKNNQPILTWSVYSILILVGLFGSLKVVVGMFGLEADSSQSLILWHGVNTYGLAWLKDWNFTPDNWLLTLVPLNFLGFALFGVNPSVVIIEGWVIFICAAFVSGLIAWQLNAKRSAFLIPATLLFLGSYAHSHGFVSYSSSHNVTNLLGLIACSISIKWAKFQKNTTLFWLLLIIVAGSISDPWMNAAYIFPIGIVSIILWVLQPVKIERNNAIKLFFVLLSSYVLFKSHFFGTLNFLSNLHFNYASTETIYKNFIFFIKDFGGLFNIFPFNNTNDFIPASLSIGIVATLLLVHILKAARLRIFTENTYFVFFVFTIFSLGGIFLAFILNGEEATNASSRFLLNCLYLVVIWTGVLIDFNWETSTKLLRLFSASLIIFFIMTGITSTYQFWKLPGFSIKDNGEVNLINFLKKNDLSYGYGPYWGSNANAVTALSKSEIRIRPVRFDKTNGMMVTGTRPETSLRWYSTEDFPSGLKKYFVFVTSDGEECANVSLCISGLSTQFGNPSEVLKYGNATIMVWDHPIMALPISR